MLSWNTVWIIGGGKSREAFDLSLLRGDRVIAINGAVDFYPRADTVFSIDANWIYKNRSFLERFSGEKYVALPADYTPDSIASIPGVVYYGWSHADGLSDDPKILCVGCNSGYAAINLAYLKGSREIHLIGYDMNPGDLESYAYWAPRFSQMIPQLKAKDVRVYNHNPDSYISSFEKVSMIHNGRA
jgi:hypothetical protein